MVGPTCIRRHEQKYEVGLASAAFLREEISRHLPLYEYRSGFPHSFVTTVYYDTADRSFFRQAERSYDDNVKIRVKEYSYLDGRGCYLSSPICFVEVKRRERGEVIKRRLPLAKRELRRLVSGDDVWPEVVATVGGRVSDGLRVAYDRLRDYLGRFSVHATSVVRYRRTVFQQSEWELRVTFDDSISIYRAPRRDVYSAGIDLTPDVLGEPFRRLEKVILEIKCPSLGYPDWLARALRYHCSARLSKFTTSVRSLLDLDDGEARGRELLGKGSRGPQDSEDTRIVPRPFDE